jgi:uncharacterized protein YkwD
MGRRLLAVLFTVHLFACSGADPGQYYADIYGDEGTDDGEESAVPKKSTTKKKKKISSISASSPSTNTPTTQSGSTPAGPAGTSATPSGTQPSGTQGTATTPSGPITPSGDPAVDAARAYNLQRINEIRAQAGLAPYQSDDRMNEFAAAASKALSQTQVAHAYFSQNVGACNCGIRAENQGDPSGWTPADYKTQIDEILRVMMDEGPGGGHHDAIVSTRHTKIGMGFVGLGGELYFTNDFGN